MTLRIGWLLCFLFPTLELFTTVSIVAAPRGVAKTTCLEAILDFYRSDPARRKSLAQKRGAVREVIEKFLREVRAAVIGRPEGVSISLMVERSISRSIAWDEWMEEINLGNQYHHDLVLEIVEEALDEEEREEWGSELLEQVRNQLQEYAKADQLGSVRRGPPDSVSEDRRGTRGSGFGISRRPPGPR